VGQTHTRLLTCPGPTRGALKDTSRQLTAAFDLIHHVDPSSSPSMISQLHTTPYPPAATRVLAVHTCPIQRSLHHTDPAAVAYRLLIWLAGGTACGLVDRWNFQWYRVATAESGAHGDNRYTWARWCVDLLTLAG